MDRDPARPFPGEDLGKMPGVRLDEHHRQKHRLRRHTPGLYRMADRVSGILLYGMVIFSPWAFGSTEPWAIWSMNFAGYVLGLLLFTKLAIRFLSRYRQSTPNQELGGRFSAVLFTPIARTVLGPREQVPPRWGDGDNPRWTTLALAVLTVIILGWCFVSALNARATIDFTTLEFNYRDSRIPWLPHSYHAPASWFEFWKYLGLACTFWAARDWLLGQTRRERLRQNRDRSDHENSDLFADLPPEPGSYIPSRLRTLLWLVCLNGTVLAIEGIAQRLDGTNKLLWLVEPTVNKTTESQFGPYAYRANACQYLNLVWPVCLGFWWVLRHEARRSVPRIRRVGGSPHLVLIPCTTVIIAASFMSMSRGGALVTAGIAPAAVGVLYLAARRHRMRWAWMLPVSAGIVLGVLLVAAWPKVQSRLYAPRKAYAIKPGLVLKQFTLRCAFRVPQDTSGVGWGFVTGLAAYETSLYSSPPDAALLIGRGGGLSMMFYGRGNTWQELLLVTNLIENYKGQVIDVVVARDDLPHLYINGRPIPLPRPSSIPSMATNEIAGAYLRIEPQISVFESPPALVAAWDTALEEKEIALLHAEFSSGRIKVGDNILFTRPLIELDHTDITSPVFLIDQMTGRRETYAIAARMLDDFVWLGSGPGTFGPLNGLYRSSTWDYWTWFAHNDWLEFRITFGRIGFGLVLVALAIAVVSPLKRGGIPLPGVFPAMLWLAMAGCLVHARYDFPFQIHSVLFLFVMILCVCSVVSVKKIGSEL
ncbi:MAG: O-antigen ligase family protein [Verrucomicrobiae bacterium]|nr:O-antigen ligase family protein [Verrucomicrobiae bacterium]